MHSENYSLTNSLQNCLKENVLFYVECIGFDDGTAFPALKISVGGDRRWEEPSEGASTIAAAQSKEATGLPGTFDDKMMMKAAYPFLLAPTPSSLS